MKIKYLLMGAMACLLGGCGGEDSGGPSQPDGGNNGGNTVVITELQVTPANSRIPAGLEQQLTAQAHMSDGAVFDVTTNPNVSWSSSDARIATVDNKGLVTGINVGTATLKASGTNASGQHVEATAQVEVTSATVTGLQVTPTTASVPAGFTQAYVATALLSDGSALDVTQFTGLTWSSSDNATASISNGGATKGLATGGKPGTVTITAAGSANGQHFNESVELTVTDATPTQLVVTPATASIPMGLTQPFLAALTFSDGTTRDVTHEPALSWESKNTQVATIHDAGDDKGLATGVTAGTATIAASGSVDGQHFSASAELTVTNATVTALRLEPATATVPVGLTQPFTAIATLSDGTTRDVTTDPALSWSSSDATIATISNTDPDKGLATGEKAGITTITASGSAGNTPFSATAELTVLDAVVTDLAITPLDTSVSVGSTVQFQAMATLSDGGSLDVTEEASISWVSDAPTFVAISNVAGSRGEATGLVEGGAQITATMGGVTSPAAQLAVVPASPAGGPIVVEPRHNQIASLQVTPAEFAFWNSTSINTAEGQAALKELTAVVYGQFQDEFDFITVVMNNEEVPFRMPTGEYTHVSNDVTGIGLSLFDYTADFHSGGKLQGISFLYKKKYLSTSTYGPILHEMTHRWANWVVPSSYAGHWGQELGIVGQLNDVSANFADIELYLMGLMDATEMTDPASLAAYDLIPVDQKPRVPDTASAQKEFRALLLILSDRPLTVTEIQDYNDGATLLARTDNPSQQGTNFHKMTGGRGTLVIGGLDTLLKP